MDKELTILYVLDYFTKEGAGDMLGLTKSFLDNPHQPWEKVEMLYQNLPYQLRPLFREAYKGELEAIGGYKRLMGVEGL